MIDVLKFNSADSMKSQSSGPWKLNNAKKKETRNSFRSESGGELDERGRASAPERKRRKTRKCLNEQEKLWNWLGRRKAF